ncbi:MAG TPA: inner-membrane translocator [Ktedonobacteraceae bacterium]|nr:inner-membrane translocator [Ktedonobacteraceae bacterium]
MSDTLENTTGGTPTIEATQSVEAASVEVPSYRQRQTVGQLFRTDLGFIPVLATFIVIVIFFQVISGGLFLSSVNITNLFLQTATYGLLGLGIVLVLLLGEIDLSIAAVATFSSVIMADLSERAGVPAFVAILAALLTGALIGAINGFFVAVLRIPSFIVTLAANIAFSGLVITFLFGQATLEIANSFIVAIAGSFASYLPDILGVGLPTLAILLYAGYLVLNYIRRRNAGLRNPSLPLFLALVIGPIVVVEGVVIVFENLHGVPYSTALLFALIALFWIILTKTSFGRHIYAVGGNKEAARRAGINVVGIQIAVFSLCSLLAAVGGIVEASRGNSVASQIPAQLLLDPIAAAVIGGVSLFGGKGSVWSIVLGILIIGSLENGLALQSIPADRVLWIEGGVLLLAVTVDAILRRLQARTGR